MSSSDEPMITSVAIIEGNEADAFDREQLYDLQQDYWQKKPSRRRHPGISAGARLSLRKKFKGELGTGGEIRRFLFHFIQDLHNLFGYLLATTGQPSWLAYTLVGAG